MAKKQDTFIPEMDGKKGRVICPVDAKQMRLFSARKKNTQFADKLREALRNRA